MDTDINQAYIDTIHKRMGIVISLQQKKELPKMIAEACKKNNCTPSEYLDQLITCSTDSPLFAQFVSAFTVGETYFFRDKKQIDALKNNILPKLIQTKRMQNNLNLRIWSAGCSTGEEIYTIAILLCELLTDIESWELHLLGTDINVASLKKAIIGCYRTWSMRSINDYYKSKYFKINEDEYCLTHKITQMTTFNYLNLVSDACPSIFNGTNAQDLIICHNVLIYFDEEHIRLLTKKLIESLIPSGYLLLGASDPIYAAKETLTYHHNIGSLFSKSNETQLVSKSTPVTAQLPKLKQVSPVKPILAPKINIKDSNTLAMETMELANLGKLDQAIALCMKSLEIDPTNKVAYFTMSLILMELNRFPDAEKALRRAIYLDSQFVVAHYQLGLLLLRNNHYEAGLKSLRNALSIATTKDPNETVSDSQNLNYQKLTAIIKNEIDLHISTGGLHHVK